MGIVIDFAWTKPTVQQAKSWGAVAVGMYVSRDPAKNATIQLIHEFADAGIKTMLFFEDTANGAAKGHGQGLADARLGLDLAAKVGMPDWAPIIAGVDFDIPDYAPQNPDPAAKLGPVADYFKAWNEELTPPRTAGYGGFWAISRLTAAHLITCGIQTVAWSGGKVDTRDVACLQNGQMLDGGNVDVEIIEHQNLLDRIAWVPGEASPGAFQPVEHPTDAPWVSKGMLPLTALAAGPLQSDAATVLATTMKHAGLQGPLAVYLNAGNLVTAKFPAGTVVWYPRPAAG